MSAAVAAGSEPETRPDDRDARASRLSGTVQTVRTQRPGTLVQPGRYPAPGSVCGTTGRAPKTTCQRSGGIFMHACGSLLIWRHAGPAMAGRARSIRLRARCLTDAWGAARYVAAGLWRLRIGSQIPRYGKVSSLRIIVSRFGRSGLLEASASPCAVRVRRIRLWGRRRRARERGPRVRARARGRGPRR